MQVSYNNNIQIFHICIIFGTHFSVIPKSANRQFLPIAKKRNSYIIKTLIIFSSQVPELFRYNIIICDDGWSSFKTQYIYLQHIYYTIHLLSDFTIDSFIFKWSIFEIILSIWAMSVRVCATIECGCVRLL